MRIFVGLDIDDQIRGRIHRFMDGVREFAPDARWVRPESLHLTLKFIGEKPADTVDELKLSLGKIRADALQIVFRGYGFFPTSRSARVFWIGIESGPELGNLARTIDNATAELGVPREDRPFSPHLTLARGGSSPSNRRHSEAPGRGFQRLQEKLTAFPASDFGTMTAHEFFLYESQLMRTGSRYRKIEKFPLLPPH